MVWVWHCLSNNGRLVFKKLINSVFFFYKIYFSRIPHKKSTSHQSKRVVSLDVCGVAVTSLTVSSLSCSESPWFNSGVSTVFLAAWSPEEMTTTYRSSSASVLSWTSAVTTDVSVVWRLQEGEDVSTGSSAAAPGNSSSSSGKLVLM